MLDVQRHIEEYASRIDAVEPVSVAEILQRSSHTRPVRRWVPALVAASVTAALILWIAPLNLLSGGETESADQPSVTSNTVPVTSATSAVVSESTVSPTSTTTIAAQQRTVDWAVAFDGAFGEGVGQINAITRFGDRMVAVGYDEEAADGVVWVLQPDGTSTRTALFGGDGWQWANDVVAVGDELVVVGNSEDGSALVAISADAVSWETMTVGAEGPDADPAGMEAIAARSGLLVAVGTDIWTSTDGREWTLALDLPARSQANDVVADDQGILVGGQSILDGSDAAAWWSMDGSEWTDVSSAIIEPEGWNGFIYGVAATPRGFVAGGGGTLDPGISPTGGMAASDAALWTSTDGTTWSQVDHDAASLGGGRGQWVESIISFDDVVFAVGVEMGTNWQAARGVVWESQDGGTSWQRIDDPDAVFGSYYGGFSAVYDVIEDDGGLVAAGRLESLPAVWFGTGLGR